MKTTMKKRWFSNLMVLTLALAVPATTLASSDDEETDGVDARLKGYKDGVMAEKDASGTGLTWFLLAVLGGMTMGVMFINSKRTHLD
jgi:hypothetical protein